MNLRISGSPMLRSSGAVAPLQRVGDIELGGLASHNPNLYTTAFMGSKKNVKTCLLTKNDDFLTTIIFPF